ncbi:TPA: hypothetical protein N0F65_002537 [Lagenidium giganteum]|uniref:PDZ domain-containing protein n=1 Tax=Lagenidium giganteum TaxID=4803 RepID=A0AAV2YQ32_9STRA|nr:TPA: hypothetical protein N0F65_002537 [Lagenidium giganteum]
MSRSSVTSPTSIRRHQAYSSSPNGSTCNSFISSDKDLVVRYQWDGESIGLELVRLKSTQVLKTVRWNDDTLGVTFGIEETSRKIIVTKTTRTDLKPGDILLTARGEQITDANFDEKMATLKLAHSISHGIPFEFVSPPPPVYVKTCSGLLKQAGVDSSFELRSIDGRSVRYLSLNELNDLIRRSPKPCEMVFVQRRENQYLATLRRQANEEAMAAAALATTAAVCAISIC